MTRWQQIARDTVGADYAQKYAARFRALAERGDDVHGEATFVTGLVDPPARVLDAGCGTGRVAIRLAGLGYDVVGVDLDASMLRQARAEAPDLDWRVGDLAVLDTGEIFDVVLVAGNTIPLLEPGTLESAAAHLAAQLDRGRAAGLRLRPRRRLTCPATARSPRWPTSTRRSRRRGSSRSTGSRPGTARRTTRPPATS